MDTRIETSKKMLAESLISLMKRKDFSRITNQDITNHAGLSHITIYRHFKGKDDIIQYYLDHITDQFIQTSQIIYSADDFAGYILQLFTHLEEYKEIGILLDQANLFHFLKDEFDRIFFAKAHSLAEEYYYAFLSGGFYNVYYYWIKNGCVQTPKELSQLFVEQI